MNGHGAQWSPPPIVIIFIVPDHFERLATPRLNSRLHVGSSQRRYDMRHEMLTQCALFFHHVNTKRGTLSQHFVTHVVPPLGSSCAVERSSG